jgi:hypothetical protein
MYFYIDGETNTTFNPSYIPYLVFGRGTSKLPELVPNPFEYINKICSKLNI